MKQRNFEVERPTKITEIIVKKLEGVFELPTASKSQYADSN